MAESAYDLVVIGSGPGGYIAAIRAAQLGMRVACVEKDATLGGTCLNVGCIPSKALLESSQRFYEVTHQFPAHGIIAQDVRLDLAKLLARKDTVVKTVTRGVEGLFKKHKITWARGTARILAPDRVEVRAVEITAGAGSGAPPQVLSTARILIATGSAPIELPMARFDGQRIVSSTEALALPAVPKRLIVIGGGAIGLEMGSVWSRLGADVLVIEMLDRIVPGMDSKMGKLLQRALEKQGLRFALRTTLAKVERGDALTVTATSDGAERQEICDVLLVAVGRRPYTDGLGLEGVGVRTDERGRVVVDQHFATNVAGIYAIGDVIAGPMLAHKAEEEGVAAVEGMAGVPGHVNYDAVPNVVYTHPELASVGVSEDDCAQRGLSVRIGTFPFAANARARGMGEIEGQVKVIADAATDRVLGIHILGPHASDVIAEAALAMEFSASAEDIGRAVHAHPTLAEALKEAALAVDGRPLNL